MTLELPLKETLVSNILTNNISVKDSALLSTRYFTHTHTTQKDIHRFSVKLERNLADESRYYTHTCIHTPNLLPRGASLVAGGALHLLWQLGASWGRPWRRPRRGAPGSNLSLLLNSTLFHGMHTPTHPAPPRRHPSLGSSLRRSPKPQLLLLHVVYSTFTSLTVSTLKASSLSEQPFPARYSVYSEKNKRCMKDTCNFLPQTPSLVLNTRNIWTF